MSNLLYNYRLLIADADPYLGKVLRGMLAKMGFVRSVLTTDGVEAMSLLQSGSFDFVITDWNLKNMEGIELLNRTRRAQSTLDPTLPIIMLTGRAEQADVITARDCGINEYVIKPFTSSTIYDRLERLIEKPRDFVVSTQFVGPDRRNRNRTPAVTPDRRVNVLQSQPKPINATTNLNSGALPKIWSTDYSLKVKLGMETALSSIITPEALVEAQALIDNSANDSLQWIKEDLIQLKSLHRKMTEGDIYTLLPIDVSEASLSMSSRTGTVGYTNASNVSYLLYCFSRYHLKPEKPMHQLIVQKHIEVLQVSLGRGQRGNSTDQDHQIIKELKHLVEKYAEAA